MEENIEPDGFDNLNEDQQQAVFQSLEKLDLGEGITHEEAVKLLNL